MTVFLTVFSTNPGVEPREKEYYWESANYFQQGVPCCEDNIVFAPTPLVPPGLGVPFSERPQRTDAHGDPLAVDSQRAVTSNSRDLG